MLSPNLSSSQPLADTLHIAPPVLELLDPETLNAVFLKRDTSVVHCKVCGGEIAPESPIRAEVVAGRDPRGTTIVGYTHPECQRSCVETITLPGPPSEFPTSWTALFRSHVFGAVILWELAGALRVGDSDAELYDPIDARLRAHGFRPVLQRVDDIVAPLVPGWKIRPQGLDLVLDAPDGNKEAFDDALGDGLPDGWLAAAKRTKRVLVVYGSGFGLERPDPERIDRALQVGSAVGGLVKWVGAPPGTTGP